MTSGTRATILSALSGTGGGDLHRALCATCVEVLAVSGASVGVTAEGLRWGALCASDSTAAVLVNLEDTLGEGPSCDAHRLGAPVSEPDLAKPRDRRWVAYAGQAHAAGAAAVFAFPMRVGAARLGALTLHQNHPGYLSDGQYGDAVTAADALTDVILALQADAPPGVLAGALEPVVTYRAEVHQAAGMLAARHRIGVGEALVRLRANAFAESRTLVDVAADVIDGRLNIG